MNTTTSTTNAAAGLRSSPPIGSGLRFTARCWGYYYEWVVTSEVQQSKDGHLFVWAKPVTRLGPNNKRGRLRAETAWYLTVLRPEFQHAPNSGICARDDTAGA